MRRLCLMILSLCMLVLSGCATINSDIHINRDGSGSWDATVKSQAEPIEKKVITEVLAKYPMPEYTIKAINNEGKAIKVDDNDTAEYNTWSIASEFKNIDEFTLVRNAMTLKDKNKNLAPALEKTTSGTYIVDLGTSLGNTTVSVSGTIDKVSVQSGTLKNDNTITFTQNEHMRFIFKPDHSWFFYIGIGVGIIIIIGGAYIFYLRRKYYGDAA